MGSLGRLLLFLLLLVFVKGWSSGSLHLEEEQVGQMVGRVVTEHLPGCHLVLWSATPHSAAVSAFLREAREGVVVMESKIISDRLPLGLWTDSRTTCRALILHLDTNNNNNTNAVLGLVEEARVLESPETRVIAWGRKATVDDVFLHHSLRNTRVVLYLAVHHPIMNRLENLNGHNLRIIALTYFPYMDFSKIKGQEPGGQVNPKDSLDYRMLVAYSEALNFTYNYYEEPNRSFGDEKEDGQFTGMVGQLQREESDLTTIIAPTPGRLRAVNFLRLYPSDVLVIASLKPKLLPAQTALIRPFSGKVWAGLLLGVVVWGVILWGLQGLWVWITGSQGVQFVTALLYGWGALLERPPSDPSINVSGQILVGWWLVFCLIVTTGFRSSLISHLTVQSTSKTLENFGDLVEQNTWGWGTEPWLYNGAALEYFSKHSDPVVQSIHKGMEVLVAKDALGKVSQGGFSFIIVKNYITVVVATRYTDTKGQTPFYISKQGITFLASFGWGFRKGAPFYSRFQQVMHRLEDAGLIKYWTDDVIATRVRETRAAAREDTSTDSYVATDTDTREVILGLSHLQGAFYLLFLGSFVAFLALVGENLLRSTPN